MMMNRTECGNKEDDIESFEEEIEKKKGSWKQPALNATKGVLFKYAQCVKDASRDV
jgi:dihydroxy-acid dehydratase